MRFRIIVLSALITLLFEQAALAQFGKIMDKIGKAEKTADKFKDLEITPSEEYKIGEEVSLRVRQKYGVVQDAGIHKYVSLVGTMVARKSSKPDLKYQYIVLDTDGVNAFAAPGGFVHITRGALALLKNESELAGVLGHETGHVVERHTITAIQKGKAFQMGANETLSSNPELFRRVVDKAYEVVYAGFGRAEELEADAVGLAMAAKAGYAPDGVAKFLMTLKERNSGSQEKQGLFASHPQTDERIEKMAAVVEKEKWSSDISLETRYKKFVKYEPTPLTEIAVVAEGTAGLAEGKKEERKEGEEKKERKGFLSKLKNPIGSGGEKKQSAEVTGSGGTRAIDKERLAKGGSNPNLIAVTVSDKDIEQFKKEGKLS